MFHKGENFSYLNENFLSIPAQRLKYNNQATEK